MIIHNLATKKIDTLLQNTGDMALKRRAREIITTINPQPGDRILDIGCGDGYYLHLLSNIESKAKLFGTDYDDSGLERARKNIKNGIQLRQGDLMKKLPYKAHMFDKAVMSEVAEHLPDDVKGLKEVRRVLKKGGLLALTVPNHKYPFLWDPVNWVLEKTTGKHIRSGFFAGLWNQHERLYTTSEIRKKVESAGFDIVEMKALTWWCLPFNHYIVNLVARMLASGTLSETTSQALSKYTKKPKRGAFLDFVFAFVNQYDRLNDIKAPKDKGVGVFVLARK